MLVFEFHEIPIEYYEYLLYAFNVGIDGSLFNPTDSIGL